MDPAVARVAPLFFSCDEAFKANSELAEAKIKELKSRISERSDIYPGLSDQQYALFLHSVYGDVDAAVACMDSFYQHARENPQFFDHWDPARDHVMQGLDVAYYAPLPNLSPRKHLTLVCKYRISDASKYRFSDGVRLVSMSMEAQLLQRGPQEGICVILDMRGMTFGHIWRFPIPLVQKFIEMLQVSLVTVTRLEGIAWLVAGVPTASGARASDKESLPVRLKEIHITNCSYFLPTLMSFIKPFMKKELADMIQCHSGAMESFYEQFPIDFLPEEFGGTQGDLLTHHNNNIELLTKMAPMWRARDEWMAKARAADQD